MAELSFSTESCTSSTPGTPGTPQSDRPRLKVSLGMGTIFEDPISFELMENAVITPCGHSFSQLTLDDWLETQQKCPLCNATLHKSDVVANYSLREAINKYEALKNTLSGSAAIVEAQNKEDCARFDLTTIIKPSEDTVSSVEDFEIPKIVVEKNLIEKGDTYVIADFQETKKQTTIVKASPDPLWEESLIFNIDTDEIQNATLTLTVNRRGVLHQHFLGKVDFPFSTIQARRKLSGWYALEKKSSKDKKIPTGRLHIRISLLGSIV